MEQFIEEFDLLYKKVIGDYSVEMARGTMPVSYHGSQIKEEFMLTWHELIHFIHKMDCKTISFLEIGAYKGLWPLMLSKVCKEYGKVPEYTTVTLLEQDSANHSLAGVEQYYKDNNWTFNLIDADSNLDSTKQSVLNYGNSFNFVFIDADHRYNYAKKDIELYSPLCSDVQIFHDVKPRIATEGVGVWQAICDNNITIDKEFSLYDINYGLGLKFI